MWKGVTSLKSNIGQLLKIRFHVLNSDMLRADTFGGVRFNREHYQKVLEAKQELLKNKIEL